MKKGSIVLMTLLVCSILAGKQITSEPEPRVWIKPVRYTIADTLKIMPIGNSITQAENQGVNQYNSWRRELFQRLSALASPTIIDFIGSHSVAHPGVGFPNNDFDQDHEGHWGWRIDEIRDHLGRWISSPQVGIPDMALIHLGSNDCFQGQSVSSSILELEQVIDTVRKFNPTATIFLAQIIPSTYDDSPCIQQLNDSISILANRLNTVQSQIVLVDQFSGFFPESDTYDAIHPNQQGEMKMAEKWYQAIKDFIPTLTPTDVFLNPGDLTLYPNPTDGFFEIRGQLDQYDLELLDSTGQLYSTLNNTQTVLQYDLSNLPSGLYFIRIRHRTVGKLWVEQIVKM